MGSELVSSAAALLYAVISFLLGGGTMLAAIVLLANLILKSPVLIKALEHLANSANPELLKALYAASQVVEEVTDEVPYEDKQQLPSAIGTAVEFTPSEDIHGRLGRTGIGFQH